MTRASRCRRSATSGRGRRRAGLLGFAAVRLSESAAHRGILGSYATLHTRGHGTQRHHVSAQGRRTSRRRPHARKPRRRSAARPGRAMHFSPRSKATARPQSGVAMAIRMRRSSLVARTRNRETRQAEDLIRAFATWFQMVNMAEKVHRVRRRRQYLNDSSTPQPGGLEECLIRLRARGVTLLQVVDLLGTLSIEPVLTAHPDGIDAPHVVAPAAAHRAPADRAPRSERHARRTQRHDRARPHGAQRRTGRRPTIRAQSSPWPMSASTCCSSWSRSSTRSSPSFTRSIEDALVKIYGDEAPERARSRGAAFWIVGGRRHGRPPGRARQDDPRKLRTP